MNLLETLLQGRHLALPTNNRLAGKAFQGQKLQLIMKIRKLRTKKFYNIGHSWGGIHKTYIDNLTITLKVGVRYLQKASLKIHEKLLIRHLL